MSVPLVINGQTYDYPELNDSPPDVNWGVTATDWAIAVTQGMLQKAGGNFVLTADANFGPNFGLLAKYFSSRITPVAQSGLVRLDNTNFIAWRNLGDTADLPLAVNASNQLTFDGNTLAIGSAGDVTGPGSSTDNAITRFDGITGKLIQNSACTIDDTGKLFAVAGNISSLIASKAVCTDGSKNLVSSTTSDVEIGYLTGAQGPVVSKGAMTVFTSSGTWTKATLNPRFVKVTVIGGGGGGGGAASTSGSQFACASGGAGGGCSIKTILAASLGATETVTVGAAGSGGSAGNDGTSGGTSSFGTFASATGGAGGLGSAATSSPQIKASSTGGVGSLGDINFGGGHGGGGVVETNALGTGFGGSSFLAGSVPQIGNVAASDGNGYGGGGAGAQNGNSQSGRFGGDAVAGVVIVEEFY